MLFALTQRSLCREASNLGLLALGNIVRHSADNRTRDSFGSQCVTELPNSTLTALRHNTKRTLFRSADSDLLQIGVEAVAKVGRHQISHRNTKQLGYLIAQQPCRRRIR